VAIDATLKKSSTFVRFCQYLFLYSSRESTIERSKPEMQHGYERGKLVNDYIKVLAYRPSFSSASKVATLDGAYTLDLRPASPSLGRYIHLLYPDTARGCKRVAVMIYNTIKVV
jgi:hypothetical protein